MVRFLWVVFQIDTLCAQKSDADIVQTLGYLPHDLGETFNRILRKAAALGEPNVTYVQKIFWWVAMAQEPLTVEQLREALAVEPAELDWNPATLINDMDQILAMCGCLVTVDEEYGTVQFTHHSVKQHLTSPIADPSIKDWQILPEQAEKYVGEVCLTYLSSARFEGQMIRMPTVRRASAITTTGIVNTAFSQSSVTKRLAIQLLKAKSKSKSFDHRRLQAISDKHTEEPAIHDEFPLREYASRHWLHHTKYLRVPFRVGSFDVEHLARRYGDREGKLWRLWIKMVTDRDKLAKAMGFSQQILYGREALQWIVDHGHQALLRFKLQDRHFDYENPSVRAAHETLASVILTGSDLGMQEALIKSFRIVDKVLRNKILVFLAETNHPGFHKVWHSVNPEWCVTWPLGRLGDHYFTCHDIELSDSCFSYHQALLGEISGWGPLSIAAARGHVDICAIIVDPIDESSWDRPTWIYSNEGKNDLCMAFEEAAIHGHLDVALVLCANAWRTNLICKTEHRYYRGWSPLMLAVSLGDQELVESFVKQGVDIEHKANDQKTAFLVAISLGHMEIWTFLSDARAFKTPSIEGFWTVPSNIQAESPTQSNMKLPALSSPDAFDGAPSIHPFALVDQNDCPKHCPELVLK